MTRAPKFSSVATTFPLMLSPLVVTQERCVPGGRVTLQLLFPRDISNDYEIQIGVKKVTQEEKSGIFLPRA